MLTDLQIITSFATEETINNCLYALKTKIEFEKAACESITQKKRICDSYKQKVYAKLTTILRRQIFLDTEEAIAFYGKNINVLNDRINLLFNIIDSINDDLDVTFIPDRLFICAYFRINAETFDTILNDPRADIPSEMRMTFRNIEELILSMTTNAIENGNLGQSAWKRLTLKSKFGGNEVQSVEANNVANSVIISNVDEVAKRLGTSYNFKELELEGNKKEG